MGLNTKSALKADQGKAKTLWEFFKKENLKPELIEKGISFRKKDLSNEENPTFLKGSFEIRFTRKEGGRVKGTPIFRFIKRECGNEVEWDDRLVTI